MDLNHKLVKVTSRTLALYLMIGLLMFFTNPSKASRFFGMIFVIGGEALRFWAAGHIRKNDELTASGPYAHLQSPLYLGSYTIGTGMCIIARNPVIWLIGSIVFFCAYLPRKKEKEWGRLEKMFGDKFLEYKKSVKYFMPRLTPYPGGAKHPWSFAQSIENTEHQTGIVVALISIFTMFKFI